MGQHTGEPDGRFGICRACGYEGPAEAFKASQDDDGGMWEHCPSCGSSDCEELPPDEVPFWNAYERLSQSGKCDLPGGAEYTRVVGEWKAAGEPEDMEAFIVRRANAMPLYYARAAQMRLETNAPAMLAELERIAAVAEDFADMLREMDHDGAATLHSHAQQTRAVIARAKGEG